MSKFISKITARSSSHDRSLDQKRHNDQSDHEEPTHPHSSIMNRRSSSKKSILSINTTTPTPSVDEQLSSSDSSLNTKPIVKSPNWSIRYDPSLSVYYYVNEKTNEIQFDHPDEVVSPTESPISETNNNSTGFYDTDHKKFSTSLKRSLSPRFLSHSHSFGHHSNKSNSQSPRSSIDHTKEELINGKLNIPKSSKAVDNTNEMMKDETDEDVEEFRKQLELEMKSYECERLRST